jgi:hypothetical protein
VAGGLTLDAGALIAAEKGSRSLWAAFKKARSLDVEVTVPLPALARVWRGDHPRLTLLLAGCMVESFDERFARRTGRLLGRSRTVDVVDAAVAIGAVDRGDAIWTSDPDELRRLVDHLGASAAVLVVPV